MGRLGGDTVRPPTSQVTCIANDDRTYPTTYVHYLGFEGAAASTNTACAEPLIPSALTLPTSTDAASFIYPQVTGAATLPAGLLGYLDADGGIPSQLNGDQLTGCGAINVAVVSVASTTATFTIPPNVTLSELPSTSSEETTTATITSTSFSASTQTLTSETTVATTVSAESSSASETSVVEGTTLTAVSPVPVTTQQTVVTTQTISHQPAVFLNTITGAPIVPPSATQQSEVLDSTSASSAASASSASAQASALISNLFNVLGSLAASENAATSSQASESAAVSSSVAMASSVATTSSAFTLAPGPYTNGTSASALPSFLPSVYPTGTLPGNASGTTSPISYTGAAQKDLPGSFSLGGVLGVLAAALFL